MPHTPGPWRIGDAGLTVFGPPNGNPSPETICRPNKQVNVPLIAAAPELLAMLKGVLHHNRVLKEQYKLPQNLVNKIEMIITKAEKGS